MLILAGEAEWQEKTKTILATLGYTEEKTLPSFHARGMFSTAPAANQGSLIDWLTKRPELEIDDFKKAMDKSPISANEWVARIRSMKETVGVSWYIHDYRPLWFLPSFVEAVEGEVKIIALISNDTEYQEAIARFFEKRLPTDLAVLKINKPPVKSQIEKFLKEKPPALTKDVP